MVVASASAAARAEPEPAAAGATDLAPTATSIPAAGRRVEVVIVHVDPCLGRSARQSLVDALRVELRELAAAVVAEPAPLAAGRARVALSAGRSCDATRLVVRVWVGPDAIVPGGERQLDLAPTPDPQRDRIVAITAAELLAVALDDPRRDARPVDAPRPSDPAPASPAARPPPGDRPDDRQHRMFAGASLRAGLAPTVIHGGPRFDARIAVSPWLDATGSAIAWLASDTTPLGDVDTSTLVGRGGIAVARRRAWHQLDLGAYAELGRTSIAPTPASDRVTARDAAGVVFGVGLAAGGELRVVGPVRLRLEVDLAHAVASVEGEAGGRAVPGYGGAFASAALAVGLGF